MLNKQDRNALSRALAHENLPKEKAKLKKIMIGFIAAIALIVYFLWKEH